EILLQNVLLLSINKITDAANAGGEKDKNSKEGGKIHAVEAPATATLAVLPQEALRLLVASQAGRVYLVLRPFRPTEPYTIDTDYAITLGQGRKTETTPAAPMQVPSSAPAPAYTPPAQANNGSYDASHTDESSIEVIRGTEFSK
ncbi:MAG: Flp pilus assembly protein CpaB, partial [Selenomonadaceae bacterium]|nr:Flp pilus assembly protein CpaB [Selenomonadaceae bacterium]